MCELPPAVTAALINFHSITTGGGHILGTQAVGVGRSMLIEMMLETMLVKFKFST